MCEEHLLKKVTIEEGNQLLFDFGPDGAVGILMTDDEKDLIELTSTTPPPLLLADPPNPVLLIWVVMGLTGIEIIGGKLSMNDKKDFLGRLIIQYHKMGDTIEAVLDMHIPDLFIMKVIQENEGVPFPIFLETDVEDSCTTESTTEAKSS